MGNYSFFFINRFYSRLFFKINRFKPTYLLQKRTNMKKTLTLALLFYASVVAFCGCKTNHTVQTPNYPTTTLKSTIYKGVNGDYITLQQTKTELLLNGSPYISKSDVEKHYKPRKRPKQ